MFAHSLKILVVDDFVTMRRILRKVLSELGYKNVTEAEDGAVAWPLLEASAQQQQPFQLVISDWNMPNMKGIDLLRHCRTHATLAQIPFMLVLAETEQKNTQEGVQAGVSDYLIKPFNTPTMKIKLEGLYKRLAKVA